MWSLNLTHNSIYLIRSCSEPDLPEDQTNIQNKAYKGWPKYTKMVKNEPKGADTEIRLMIKITTLHVTYSLAHH